MTLSTDPRVLEVYAHMQSRLGARLIPHTHGEGVLYLRARLDEGATVADCVKAFDAVYRRWFADPTMRPYVHPGTVFRKRKFPRYLDWALAAEESPDAL